MSSRRHHHENDDLVRQFAFDVKQSKTPPTNVTGPNSAELARITVRVPRFGSDVKLDAAVSWEATTGGANGVAVVDFEIHSSASNVNPIVTFRDSAESGFDRFVTTGFTWVDRPSVQFGWNRKVTYTLRATVVEAGDVATFARPIALEGTVFAHNERHASDSESTDTSSTASSDTSSESGSMDTSSSSGSHSGRHQSSSSSAETVSGSGTTTTTSSSSDDRRRRRHHHGSGAGSSSGDRRRHRRGSGSGSSSGSRRHRHHSGSSSNSSSSSDDGRHRHHRRGRR